MISEVDLRDWQDDCSTAYGDYMSKHAHQHPYSNEVWKAAWHCAFQHFQREQDKKEIEELAKRKTHEQ